MRRKYPPRGRVEEPYKVNLKILASKVRVVGENVEVDVYDIDKALQMARDQGLDQKKKQKEIKAKASKTVIKEIRFGPNTDDHDFNFKLNHAIGFLKDGSKVKAYVHFRGRTIVYKERGEILLLKFAQALEEYAKVEQLPKLEGKRMFLYLTPKAIKK